MSESRLIGRTAYLDDIQQQVYHCLSGQPQVLLIEGLAGIGKTRFLEAAAAMAGRQGMDVYTGHCDELLTQPYAPFADLMTRLEASQVLNDSDMNTLRRFFDASGLSHPTSSMDEVKHDQIQLRLALSRGIIALAQRQPMLLIVEDLHTADQPSLEAFAFLIFALAAQRSAPLLLVGSYRPAASEKVLFGQVLSRLRGEEIVHSLELPGLEEAETRELLQQLGVARPTQHLVRTLQDQTHGIPLFIEQAVHHAISTGTLYERAGYLSVHQDAVATWRLPQTISDAIAERIASLPVDCLGVLTLASLLGDPFSVEHLMMLTQGDQGTIRSALDTGMVHGVIIQEQNHFRFAHGLIRQGFSMRLDAEQRQYLHLQIAEGFERLYRGNPVPHAFEIAHHLIEAGAFVDARTLITYAKQAGDQARAQFAWSESVRYYEAALSAAEAMEDRSQQELAALYFDAGFGHHSNLDVGPALDRFERAAAYYRELGDTTGLANALMYLVRLAFMYETVPMGTLPPHVAELEAVLSTLSTADLRLRGYVLALLAQTYRFARQPERAVQLATTGLSLGRQAEDDRVCAQSANSLGLAHLSGLRVESAIDNWQISLSAARATGDLILQMVALTNLPLALNFQGALEEGEAMALEGVDIANITQYWSEHSKAISHLVSIAAAKGQFTNATQYARDTMVMVERSRYPWSGFRALGASAYASANRGLWDEASQALDTLITPGRVFASPSPFIRVYTRVFRQLILGYGSTLFTERIALLHDELMQVAAHDTYSLAPLCAMIEMGDLALMPAWTERPAEMLAVAMERGVLFSSGWCFLIPRILGIAARMQGDWDQSEAHFQHAMAVAAYANALPELARTYLDYAQLICLNPNTEDYTPARELLQQARWIFYERNMIPFAHLTSKHLEKLFPQQAPEDPDTDTNRNGEEPPPSTNGTTAS